MGWQGHLTIRYHHDGVTTTAHDRHEGPLRVLQRLYPEGPAVCHHVLVHPPGGIVGGDTLALQLELAASTHAVLTTPGATRFYRSGGELARQSVQATLADGARLEWLPLETLAHSGCEAENRMRFVLDAGAQMIGWDLLALGLPAAGQPFDTGRFCTELELPGRWIERGRIAADDRLLLDSPLGLAGRRVLGILWFAAGNALPAALADGLLEAARACAAAHAPAVSAGATAPDAGFVVLRLLAPRVEPAMALLAQVRAACRRLAWGLDAHAPRVWKT